ncbi:MAG: PAS domain S-box protein [Desulfotignum sp.]|nr:PAS domain S-box protein [Desulfotignum sp.]MCF8086821.1 PAS domain S-box protein [Desulfotignum sp.]MCF8136770.1 PAS domain S-box protein [Desulfotignum sp.]
MPAADNKFKAIVQSLEDGYYEVDLAGNLVSFNQAMCDILGYDPSEMTGMNNRIFMDKENAEKVFQTFNQVYQTKKGCKAFDWQLIRKDGSVRHVDTSVSLVTGVDGNPVGFHGIARDMTEQKSQALRLQQSQKLEALGTLAAGISHDFNNILSGIFGYAQLAKISLDNPRKASEQMDQVLAAAQRAAGLVQQVLAFSRETGDQKKQLRVYLIVKESMKLLRSSFPAFIEMETRLDSKQMIPADPAKIHQMFMGLCLNAYQTLKKNGGVLTVSLTDEKIIQPRQIQGKQVPAGEYLKLSVADTGHDRNGKTPDTPVHPDTDAKTSGKLTGGMDLNDVQMIVDDHDGMLIVHTQPDKGTTVEVFFPVAGAETEPASEERAPARPVSKTPSQRSGKIIMLVDDEKAIRQIYEEFLTGHGYEVVLFENGAAALKAFESDPNGVDLVITDMTMPELTGDKLSENILEIRPDMPIILWCGFSEDISEDTATGMGIKKYIQKPVSPRDLLQSIQKILDEN